MTYETGLHNVFCLLLRLPFSKEAMICVNDFGTFDEAIQYIKEVDQNDELYLSKLAANPLRQGFIAGAIFEE